MSKEALKLALDALINHEGNYKLEKAGAARSLKAITVIKHALEQPVQPVAWLKTIETPGGFGKFVEAKPNEKGAKPVYTAPPAQEIVCSTGLCHYKPAAQPAQKRHVSYVCPQCHWSLEKQPAPEQYTALEQALTRLQKRYGELEAKVAAQRPWVGLTDEQRSAIIRHHSFADDIIKVTTAKLKELNT
jgi:hypothetical protein